jgi:UDP-N-acetylmuramate dehydrogenase
MTVLDQMVAEGLVDENVPLGPMTTYKSGGPARFLMEAESVADLQRLAGSGIAAGLPILVIGRGSNLVVSDAGFPGLVVHLGARFGTVTVDGITVTGGASAPLAQVARASVNAGITGLEFFVGIPGSVGGAIRQNAGCFGQETRDRLTTCTIFDLGTAQVTTRGPDRLDMSYRHSNLEANQVVLEATFAGEVGDVTAGLAELRRITRWRRDNQPGGTLNAGSVFKNPPGQTAGEIIDSIGLKGMKVGDVSVSTKHANFFVAGPRATSRDIRGLVEAVKDRVREATGTILEPEIQFVGFDDEH